MSLTDCHPDRYICQPVKPFWFAAMLSKTIANIEARIGELRIEIAQHPLSLELAILEEARDKLRRIPAVSEVMDLATLEPDPEPERLTLLKQRRELWRKRVIRSRRESLLFKCPGLALRLAARGP